MANWKDSSGAGGGIPGPQLQLHQPVHQCPEQKGVVLPRFEALSPQGTASSFSSSLSSSRRPQTLRQLALSLRL